MRHDTVDSLMLTGNVGDWAFDGDNEHLYLQTPIGLNLLPIGSNCREEWVGPCWQWNGSLEAPTLTPSIRTWTEGREWHGWLREGKLVTA